MPLISNSIPNLVNGVSQQPDGLRLSSQAALQDNCYPSVVEGLKKRPPMKWMSKLFLDEGLNDNKVYWEQSFIHFINRSVDERYVLLIQPSGAMRIWDLDGNEKTITHVAGNTYKDAPYPLEPRNIFKAITINDYTFLLNTAVQAKMSAAKTTNRANEAVIHIRQGAYKTDYKIDIGGAYFGTAHYETDATNPDTIQTDYIMQQLDSLLTSSFAGQGTLSDWVIDREESSLHLYRNDGADFELKVADTFGGNGIIGVKRQVQRFSDLPTIAPRDYIVEVTGEDSNQFDNYWVKFQPDNATDQFGKGVWVETVAPNITYQYDLTTMPHVLVRESNGTFTWKHGDWEGRTVGDTESAPNPSFIDGYINEIFFHRNRLGFLSKQNIIMSRAGEYFGFFPTTVTASLDNAPIDVEASHTKVNELHGAIPFDGNLLLLSEQTQFVLEADGALTPTTVEVTPTTEFESSSNCSPVGIGSNVYFVVERGRYSGVHEYYVKTDSARNDASDITDHVPKYIPKDVFQIEASSMVDVLVLANKSMPNIIYLYKYFWSGNEKLQSAWGRVVLPDGYKVLKMKFIDSDLILAVQDPSYKINLLKMTMEEGHIDTDSDIWSPEGYVTHLDYRIAETEMLAVNYYSSTQTTNLSLPFTLPPDEQSLDPYTGTKLVVVTRPDAAYPNVIPGQIIPIKSTTSTTINLDGDWRGVPLFVGIKYEMKYRFSKAVMKEQAPGGGMAQVMSGRLQLKYWYINFTNSGAFKVRVTPLLNKEYMYDPKIYNYVIGGRVVGAGDTRIGEIALTDGTMKVPVMARNDRVEIEVVNDSILPSNLTSAEYEAMWTQRSKRL